MNETGGQTRRRLRIAWPNAVLTLGILLLSVTGGCESAGSEATASLEQPRATLSPSGPVDPQNLEATFRKVLEYVDDRGLVRYADLKAHRVVLDRFVSLLGNLDRSTYEVWPEPTQIAFWINAYNGLTLQVIVNHYPIQSNFLTSLRFPRNSIRQISGAWDELEFQVMDRKLTLDDIEHGILRRHFEEPRIHMALVCAALGCPPLRNEPYSGERLDAQLDDQTRRFLATPSKFRVDRTRGTVGLSPIFDWYGDDFVEKYRPAYGFDDKGARLSAVLNFVGQYSSSRLRDFLESGDYSVYYLSYDWSLNEQSHG